MQAAARVLLPARWGYFSREGGCCLPALPEQNLGWVLAGLGTGSAGGVELESEGCAVVGLEVLA